jgi:pyruvate formate lyase activating enzyme
MHEALLYEKIAGGKSVRCSLCRFRCAIPDGGRGVCHVRENRGGTLYSLVYGRLTAENIDPVEKKPLYHYLPGTMTYSIATRGCNFRCRFCQNYSISQVADDETISPGHVTDPAEVVASAIAAGCRSVSYTYTEPTVFFEFALDCARLAHEQGLGNVFVSNGYITPEALDLLAPVLTAANIDLKGGSDRIYNELVGAKRSEVLASILDYKRRGIWIELTTLIIPGWNDSDEDLTAVARFIAREVGPETPWHVSRFYPTYRLNDVMPTPPSTIKRAREIGLAEGLRYVYEGNVPGSGGESTCCPACGETVIARTGYMILAKRLTAGCCEACGEPLDGVWS